MQWPFAKRNEELGWSGERGEIRAEALPTGAQLREVTLFV